MTLNNYIVCIKYFSCALILIATGAVKAESPAASAVEKTADLQLESQQEPDIYSDYGEDEDEYEDEDEDEVALPVIEWASEGEDEQYNIYRKDNPADPCDRGQDTYDYEVSWYDHTQIYVNSRFCEPALWFDNFFGNDRVFAEGVAGTYIRWRNELTVDEEDGNKFKSALSASVELPGVQDRLRLTFDSGEDEDLRDVAPGAGEDTKNTLGLQLDIRENLRSKFNVNISFQPKIRFRYRYTYPVTETLTLRLTQEVQREKSIHSARSLFDYEQLLEKQLLFRSSTEGKVSEDFDGIDWLQAFVLFQRISSKTSLSYEASVNGISEPKTVATNYRLAVRYRKNFHRKWLFYEISPEMTWPITYGEQRQLVLQDRRSKWLIFFRLEVHFGNAYKKRYQDYI